MGEQASDAGQGEIGGARSGERGVGFPQGGVGDIAGFDAEKLVEVAELSGVLIAFGREGDMLMKGALGSILGFLGGGEC